MAATAMTIQVTDKAKALLREALEQRGMTQRALVERLILWFTEQDYNACSVILGQVSPKVAPHLVDMLFCERHGFDPHNPNWLDFFEKQLERPREAPAGDGRSAAKRKPRRVAKG